MTYRGKVTKAGTVVLDDRKALPAGTVVSVRPKKAMDERRRTGDHHFEQAGFKALLRT